MPNEGRRTCDWSDTINKLRPGVSGNDVNGLGESEGGRLRAVFRRSDGSNRHEDLQNHRHVVDKDIRRIAAAAT